MPVNDPVSGSGLAEKKLPWLESCLERSGNCPDHLEKKNQRRRPSSVECGHGLVLPFFVAGTMMSPALKRERLKTQSKQ
jgi:hypothetical protein